jgi:hypothetical protein
MAMQSVAEQRELELEEQRLQLERQLQTLRNGSPTPAPIIEVPEAVVENARSTGAASTHGGDPEVIEEFNRLLRKETTYLDPNNPSSANATAGEVADRSMTVGGAVDLSQGEMSRIASTAKGINVTNGQSEKLNQPDNYELPAENSGTSSPQIQDTQLTQNTATSNSLPNLAGNQQTVANNIVNSDLSESVHRANVHSQTSIFKDSPNATLMSLVTSIGSLEDQSPVGTIEQPQSLRLSNEDRLLRVNQHREQLELQWRRQNPSGIDPYGNTQPVITEQEIDQANLT